MDSILDCNYKFEVLVVRFYPTLCDTIDYSPPGSSVHGILQAKLLEWVLPFPSPGDHPDPRIEPGLLQFQTHSLLSKPPGMQGSFLSLVLLCILAFDVGLSPFEDDIVTLSVICLSSSLCLIIFS